MVARILKNMHSSNACMCGVLMFSIVPRIKHTQYIVHKICRRWLWVCSLFSASARLAEHENELSCKYQRFTGREEERSPSNAMKEKKTCSIFRDTHLENFISHRFKINLGRRLRNAQRSFAYFGISRKRLSGKRIFIEMIVVQKLKTFSQ